MARIAPTTSTSKAYGTHARRMALFDAIAPVYDGMNDAMSLGAHRVWKRMAVRWSGAKPGHATMDVCCGSGDMAMRLADVVGCRGKVCGVDFAEEQLAYAKKKESRRPTPLSRRARVEWIQADALQLPFDDETFDAATCGYGLRNLTDHQKGLEEMRRVLKAGAKVAVLDFNHAEDERIDQIQATLLERVVVPVAGSLGVSSEYEYIRDSIQAYPTGSELKALAIDTGFRHASYYQIGLGLMGCLVLQK
mmetsp:Transcript_6389/g.39846  ORF Transcript_6389/g.39846 Transcript_6389/m.39846 type:complete len:249 (+) Transcript_6389:99-845(+)